LEEAQLMLHAFGNNAKDIAPVWGLFVRNWQLESYSNCHLVCAGLSQDGGEDKFC
jgi:hypothetical protein